MSGLKKKINARKKGHGYEREIAEKLRCLFPFVRRKLEYNLADCNGVDLQDTGDFKIQCKRGRNYAPINKIEEIKEEGIKLLITRGDKKNDIVCLYLEDFINLIL